jgi:hypothetical protein
MPSKYPDKIIGRAATISDLWANLITIGAWSLNLIAGIALASQNQPIKFPGLNLFLGPEYQTALLASGALSYLYFLRIFWAKQVNQGKLSLPFSDFILHELFLLKYPLLLVPPVFLLALGFNIGKSNTFVGFICGLILFFVPAIILQKLFDRYFVEPEMEEELSLCKGMTERQKWLQRIKNRISERQLVSTSDFLDEVGLDPESGYALVNLALQDYFNKFEFQENLKLSSPVQEKYVNQNGQEFQIECQILTRRDDLRLPDNPSTLI